MISLIAAPTELFGFYYNNIFIIINACQWGKQKQLCGLNGKVRVVVETPPWDQTCVYSRKARLPPPMKLNWMDIQIRSPEIAFPADEHVGQPSRS